MTAYYDIDNPSSEQLAAIYSDVALVTHVEGGAVASSASQPTIVGQMLEQLAPEVGDKVLEIGTGTGYNAALLATLVCEQTLVCSLDIRTNVIEQARYLLAGAGYPAVQITLQDGFYGLPENAPYDKIIVTVGCADISPHWVAQLNQGGTLLAPLEHAGVHPLVKLRRNGDVLTGRVVGWAAFAGIAGELGAASPWPRAYCDDPPREHLSRHRLWKNFLPSDREDFWYYLGVLDQRATFMNVIDYASEQQYLGFGLCDPGKGKVIVSNKAVLLAGEDSLWEDLAAAFASWERRQKPRICEYRLAFVQRDLPVYSGNMTYSIVRRAFRQELSL